MKAKHYGRDYGPDEYDHEQSLIEAADRVVKSVDSWHPEQHERDAYDEGTFVVLDFGHSPGRVTVSKYDLETEPPSDHSKCDLEIEPPSDPTRAGLERTVMLTTRAGVRSIVGVLEQLLQETGPPTPTKEDDNAS